jgi:hypothetical protein
MLTKQLEALTVICFVKLQLSVKLLLFLKQQLDLSGLQSSSAEVSIK